MTAEDAQSTRSSLTSVFHDMLGEGLAKQVAEHAALVKGTERNGVGLISRQQRETSRGEQRRFSTIHYRRLGEEDALEALRATPGIPDDIDIRVAAAMHARVPIWHVVVTGVDGHKQPLVVSKYFMQNLEELRELAHSCLIEFLEDDDPSVIEQAVANQQFRDWTSQWYHMSEDLNDDRSIKYICRLPGCAVLTHCVKQDFGSCTGILLECYTALTAPEPWLVLAEPMRYSGKFQCNAFHEAAYSCAPSALAALVQYGNLHELDWKACLDSDGKTALEIAQARAARSVPNADACVALLAREYGFEMQTPLSATEDATAENLLSVLWVDQDGKEEQRQHKVLPAETTWLDLIQFSEELLALQRDASLTAMVLVRRVVILGTDEAEVRRFFAMWRSAVSIGFVKSRVEHPDAALHMCRVVRDLLQDQRPPAWKRAYVLGAAAGVDLRVGADGSAADEVAAQRSRAFAEQLRALAETISSKPRLPLWRLDRFPPGLLLAEDRIILDHLAAALDVKTCAHLLCEGTGLYRFFWSRLTVIERRMLDRMRLLADVAIELVQQAIDPRAVPYLEGCVRMWMSSLCGGAEPRATWIDSGRLSELYFAKMVAELDSAFVAMLWMKVPLPGIDAALMRAIPASVMALFPKTAAILESGMDVEVQELWSRHQVPQHGGGKGRTGSENTSWTAMRYRGKAAGKGSTLAGSSLGGWSNQLGGWSDQGQDERQPVPSARGASGWSAPGQGWRSKGSKGYGRQAQW